MSTPIQLTLLSSRKHLSARSSIESIIRYAQQNDNRLTSRLRVSRNSAVFLSFCFYGAVGFSTMWYFMFGGWQDFHPRGPFNFIELLGRPFRITYTPEIYLKEKAHRELQAHLTRTNNTLKLWS